MMDAGTMRGSDAQVIDCDQRITQVDTPIEGVADVGVVAGEIRVIEISADEIKPGDYLLRHNHSAIKVMTTRRLGVVWRVAGISRVVGSDVFYPGVGDPVRVVRGFRRATLPEQEERHAPGLRLVIGGGQ